MTNEWNLTPELKDEIDNMSHFEMCRVWRFCPQQVIKESWGNVDNISAIDFLSILEGSPLKYRKN